MKKLLEDASVRAAHYLEDISERTVEPTPGAIARLAELGGALPSHPTPSQEVVRRLDEIGSPATIASAGGRYFGFVTGGALPATVAANILAAAWDQNAHFIVGSPVAAELENVALGWFLDLLELPSDWGGGFVTGTTMGNFSGLAAARHAVLKQVGWDCEKQGLFGAPPIHVVVGEEAHTTLFKALELLGLGSERVVKVPVDDQGRMRADAVPDLPAPSILCLQAGNVNSGALDPLEAIAPKAREQGAWVHLDAAFGLWARVSPQLKNQARGLEHVDSIATDLHKWLNVPYDNGLAIYRHKRAAQRALSMRAAYLFAEEDIRQPCDFTPESSRRARGVEAWAALSALGRSGVVDLIERCCRLARRFADGLRDAGFEILNQVELNQVLVSFGEDTMTERVITEVQREGTCWAGGTRWKDRAAMRISVSSWATTEQDVDRSLEAIVRTARSL